MKPARVKLARPVVAAAATVVAATAAAVVVTAAVAAATAVVAAEAVATAVADSAAADNSQSSFSEKRLTERSGAFLLSGERGGYYPLGRKVFSGVNNTR